MHKKILLAVMAAVVLVATDYVAAQDAKDPEVRPEQEQMRQGRQRQRGQARQLESERPGRDVGRGSGRRPDRPSDPRAGVARPGPQMLDRWLDALTDAYRDNDREQMGRLIRRMHQLKQRWNPRQGAGDRPRANVEKDKPQRDRRAAGPNRARPDVPRDRGWVPTRAQTRDKDVDRPRRDKPPAAVEKPPRPAPPRRMAPPGRDWYDAEMVRPWWDQGPGPWAQGWRGRAGRGPAPWCPRWRGGGGRWNRGWGRWRQGFRGRGMGRWPGGQPAPWCPWRTEPEPKRN
jgi:hypothetical protein